jgi:hypothetical protein
VRCGERPHIVFASATCKGHSGLLSEEERFCEGSGLALRGIYGCCRKYGEMILRN